MIRYELYEWSYGSWRLIRKHKDLNAVTFDLKYCKTLKFENITIYLISDKTVYILKDNDYGKDL